YFSIWHCIGLTFLVLILQLWVEYFLSGAPNAQLRDISWSKIAISSGIAGFLTAAAGAILAGFSVEDLITFDNVNVLMIASVILASFGITVITSDIGNLLQSLQPMSDDYLKVMESLSKQNVWNQLAAIAILAPITEELIFRGVMFEGLRQNYRLSTAIPVSCLLFA